ncbi:MAG: nitroreductase family protein [Burkholderiales bacterium]|nr:nitroreductase family protein [Burkholderiales bacterium]
MTSQLPMGAWDAINTRSSVRAYSPDRLDRDTIGKLLTAAVRAPTAIHEEQWVFAVIQGKTLLSRLSEQVRAPFAAELEASGSAASLPSKFNDAGFDLFYDADTLILICAEPMGKFVEADCWLAAENLMLAAHASGLGSCVIGSAILGLNQPDIKARVGIPDEVKVVVPVIVGVPAAAVPPSARRAPTIVSWKTDSL